jgi:hypothetical protein
MKHARACHRVAVALVLLAPVPALRASAQTPEATSAPPTLDDGAPELGALSAIRRIGPVGGGAPITPGALAPLSLAVGTGYGYTESVLGRDDSHHRLLGTLAAEWAALPTLHLGLRFTGRYDRHHIGAGAAPPDPGTTSESASDDDGWTGEPQLGARWSHPLDPSTDAGLALQVNLPGGRAPSIEPAAIGGALIASAARTFDHFGLVGALGYRLDRSARAVPPAARLSPADRVGLGVNAFDAVTAGVALHHRHRDLTLFAEASLQALIGSGHPPAAQWPMQIGLGARHAISDTLAGEIGVELCPSARPRLDAGAPLVDLPPRVSLLLGLLWATPRPGRRAAAARGPATPIAALAPPGPEALPMGQLRCAVRSFGGVGIAASLRIVSGPAVAGPAAPLHSRDGTFSVELAPGSYEVLIEAPHFIPQRRTIAVERNGVTLLNADLRRAK